MPDDKSGGGRSRSERAREFYELLRDASIVDVLVIRALMFAKKRGRIFKPAEPITIGHKKDRQP